MNAREHYDAGNLAEAISAITAEVKQHPTDSSRRGFLAELLCFNGELDRADKLLDLLVHQDPQAIMGVGLFRHLIRAEEARQQFYTDGRLPEFLDKPTAGQQLYLEASIRIREGKNQEAVQLLVQAEEKRPKLAGTCNGQAFADFRDLDDLSAAFFEVLTSNGKFYWIPMDHVDVIEFRPPARPRDLLWVRAHMVVRGGPDGEVFLPTLYAGTHADSDPRARLGRATAWTGGGATPARGVGLRTFLVGDETQTILELKEITLQA